PDFRNWSGRHFICEPMDCNTGRSPRCSVSVIGASWKQCDAHWRRWERSRMGAEGRWTPGQHPTPEELLLSREGQLPREEAEQVAAHLVQCWQCRAQVER